MALFGIRAAFKGQFKGEARPETLMPGESKPNPSQAADPRIVFSQDKIAGPSIGGPFVHNVDRKGKHFALPKSRA